MSTSSHVRRRAQLRSGLLAVLMWLGACSGEQSSEFARTDAAIDSVIEDDEDIVPDAGASRDASAESERADAGLDASASPGASDAGETDAGPQLRLEVRLEGDGRGAVEDSTGTIACGGEETMCTTTLSEAQHLQLTATPAPGSRFAGWTGAEECEQAAACDLTVSESRAITAIFVVHNVTLSVTRVGRGEGVVESAPTGILCGDDCARGYDEGTPVRLTARPLDSSVFVGFAGACSGAEPECPLSMSGDLAVTAEFALRKYTVTTSPLGSGAGTLTLRTLAGEACAAPCEVEHGTELEVTAVASEGSDLVGLGGACEGKDSPCRFTVERDTEVTGTFSLQNFALSVMKLGTGAGQVTSEPAAIACGAVCSASLPYGTMLTLRAVPDTASSRFTGWGGVCTGTSATCLVSVTQAREATARFELLSRTLTVSATGGGTVRGVLTGTSTQVINCGADCTESRPHGTRITLSPVFDAVSQVFRGWSGGGCTGTGSCTVTLDAAKTVSASFGPRKYTLTLIMNTANYTGTTTITVPTATPTSCVAASYPTTCALSVNHGTSVILDATGGSSLHLLYWEGCTENASNNRRCSLVMNGNRTVRATSDTLL